MRVWIFAFALLLLFGCTRMNYYGSVLLKCSNCTHTYKSLVEECVQRCQTLVYVCNMSFDYADLNKYGTGEDAQEICKCGYKYDDISKYGCPKRYPDAH